MPVIDEVRTVPAPQHSTGVPVGRPVTGPELVALAAVAVVCVLGWISLLLAHLGHHTLSGVLQLSLIALAAIGVGCWRRYRLVGLDWDWKFAIGVAVIAAVALVFSFPGFPYGVSDADPGIYVAHAQEIARSGSFRFANPFWGMEGYVTSPWAGTRITQIPGLWLQQGDYSTYQPQFFHLWPALLATAYELGGLTALMNVGPLAAVGCAVLACLIVRRLAGPIPGLIAGLLLATNMMQVWQSKYPSTEILAQLLFLATVLGLVIVVQTGWRPAAALAGLALGVSWLERPDGVLLVLAAIGVLALLFAIRRFDGRAGAFAVGLGVVLPHALLQSYVIAAPYALSNGVPPFWEFLGLSLAVWAAAFVIRARGAALVRLVDRLWTDPKVQRWVGAGLLVLSVLGVILALARRYIFDPFIDYTSFPSGPRPTEAEDAIWRLMWFVTPAMIVLMLLGGAVILLRKWRLADWIVLGPLMLLMPVFIYNPRVAPTLMWWTRRFVPTILPGMVMVSAIGLGFLAGLVWKQRRVLLIPVLAGTLVLAGIFTSQSWPLRSHHQYQGSFELNAALAAQSGDQPGVYLFWTAPKTTGRQDFLAGALVMAHGELVSMFPGKDPNTNSAYVTHVRQRFGDNVPLFIVTTAADPPPDIPLYDVTPVYRQDVLLPYWEVTLDRRPDKPAAFTIQATLWRVTPQ